MTESQDSATCLACASTLAGETPLASGCFEYGQPDAHYAWRYQLLRCQTCGMGRLHPLPSAATLSALYQGGYDAYAGDAEKAASSVGQRLKWWVAGIDAAALRQRHLPAFQALRSATRAVELACGRSVPLTTSIPLGLPKGASILDFGCGAGLWLYAMQRRGYAQLSAFDVDQPALETLRSRGIATYADDVERLPELGFDCIRLEHVLEHLLDPVEGLRTLRRKLRPSGSIVLTVPNFGSASAAELGLSWRALKLPHHLTHFTMASLQKVAKAAGLQVRQIRFLPISELATKRRAEPLSALRWQLRRHRHHAALMDSPAAEFLSAQLEPIA